HLAAVMMRGPASDRAAKLVPVQEIERDQGRHQDRRQGDTAPAPEAAPGETEIAKIGDDSFPRRGEDCVVPGAQDREHEAVWALPLLRTPPYWERDSGPA